MLLSGDSCFSVKSAASAGAASQQHIQIIYIICRSNGSDNQCKQSCYNLCAEAGAGAEPAIFAGARLQCRSPTCSDHASFHALEHAVPLGSGVWSLCCIFTVFNLNEVYHPHVDIELMSSAYISAGLSWVWHLVQMISGWRLEFLVGQEKKVYL